MSFDGSNLTDLDENMVAVLWDAAKYALVRQIVSHWLVLTPNDGLFNQICALSQKLSARRQDLFPSGDVPGTGSKHMRAFIKESVAREPETRHDSESG